MIITSIIGGLLMIVQLPFMLLPALPDVPQSMYDSLQWITNSLGQPMAFLRYLYTPTFFNIFFTVTIAILTLEFAYRLAMWVLRKIPFFAIS